ncbi:uncharacterized protein LOC107496648 [Arachis duranensis]|uniref:Uncharacterized protein LOC107496648 n=1 Tax=Arachis duranensis TaxID=130453 RepID=A0A6P5MAT3_ARADU|nr:uncharacterized protein LOC107496648 [Arachis duranensis]
MSLLINGSPSKPFKMERGLRQGDHLYPFLFVLVVDVLHKMIGEAVRNGCILPLLVGRDNIELSHLQFADDTILFCPPEEETIQNYKRLLRSFELMSGLSINYEKSNFIPVNCEQRWARKMCLLLGCKEASLLVRYLGISLGANPRLVKTWKPVIDKVEEKLSLWKAETLNKAGKLVLIKSVFNSLPIYYLSLYKIPKAVAEELISLQRRFLWSKDDGRIGIPLVKWEVVMAPKKEGGLGMGDAVVMQKAVLPEAVTSYSFTSAIWKGFAPPRVELFSWCGVCGCMRLEENGPYQFVVYFVYGKGRMMSTIEATRYLGQTLYTRTFSTHYEAGLMQSLDHGRRTTSFSAKHRDELLAMVATLQVENQKMAKQLA